MNPVERQFLDKLDHIVLTATPEELRKIQEIDRQTQLNGMSFYDGFVNSQYLANHSMKQESRDSKQ
ncbi:MAG: hypothetical protein HW410_708 [Nitrosarchaeum sp.]|jgi:hypothetical protein|nr:hypothetical protein [Nitrosarchaeum sp.]